MGVVFKEGFWIQSLYQDFVRTSAKILIISLVIKLPCCIVLLFVLILELLHWGIPQLKENDECMFCAFVDQEP